jgi:hypothetical protein
VYYPPLPEGEDTRAANRARNERERAMSQQKKKEKGAKAKRHMLRQQGRLSGESEDDDTESDGDDDDDDEEDDVAAQYEEALGLGKRPAEGVLGEPSSKRARDADPGQGSSGAASSLGLAPGQSDEVPTSVGEATEGVALAPIAEVGRTSPHPDITPAVMPVSPPPMRRSGGSLAETRPWEIYLPCMAM